MVKVSGGAMVQASILCEIFSKFPKRTKQHHAFLKKWGRTPLHYAAKNGNLAAYQLIMENVKDKNPLLLYRTEFYIEKQSPLHLAVRNGHFSICKLIMRRVNNKNSMNCSGTTPLDIVA